MDMKTIQIRVSSEIAEMFAAASEQEKRKIEALISLKLGDLTKPKRSLEEVMDSMGQYAQAQGLTPEILESILNDD
jgi:hypothetical protein